MFIFKKIKEDGEDYIELDIKVDGDADLEKMCEAFGYFLRAVGYHFDGEPQIVGEEVGEE